MLNYGISQNGNIPHYEEEGESDEIILNLYKSFGDEANKLGHEQEAISWYRRGLQEATKRNNKEKIALFSNLIFFCM